MDPSALRTFIYPGKPTQIDLVLGLLAQSEQEWRKKTKYCASRSHHRPERIIDRSASSTRALKRRSY
jgi:hypothetical protein